MRIDLLSRTDRPLLISGLVLAAAAFALAGAWIYQSMGYVPCELCLKERYPYYATLPLGALAIYFARRGSGLARVLLALLAAIFFASAIFGVYHAGVELKFWAGPTDCTGSYTKPSSMEEFIRQAQNTHIVRCDEVALRVFGLSLAAWNALISLGLSFVAAFGALTGQSKA